MKLDFSVKFRSNIESGEFRVFTRDNRKVEILKWDRLSSYPIVGTVMVGSEERVYGFTEEGKCESGNIIDDLYIMDSTPEALTEKDMTEFEIALRSLLCPDKSWEEVRKVANNLLPYAVKDLSRNLPIWKKQPYTRTYQSQDYLTFSPGYKTANKTSLVHAGDYYIRISDLVSMLPKEG